MYIQDVITNLTWVLFVSIVIWPLGTFRIAIALFYLKGIQMTPVQVL